MRKVFVFFCIFCLLVNTLAFSSFNVACKESVAQLRRCRTADSKGHTKEVLPVEIKAKSAVLMDVSTGEILLERNKDLKVFPASVTKIMTLLLVAEAIENKKISLTDKVICSENAASKGGSQIWLEPGEEMTVDELLRATVIGSANDAATLLGEYVSGSEQAFIDLMNNRGKELGMKNTCFVNATGLDDTTEEHLTTAEDIAIMSCELLKHDFIQNYTTVWMDTLRNGETELVNTNKLVRFFDGTTGLKTGTTSKAGCCISASAQRDGLHLVAVVMGSDTSDDRFNTAKNMLNWGFSNYCVFTPSMEGELPSSVSVIGGLTETVDVTMPSLSPVLIKKSEKEKVSVKAELCKDVEAPVEQNQTLGTITVTVGDKKISEYKILSKNQVKKLNFFSAMLKLFNYISTGDESYPF